MWLVLLSSGINSNLSEFNLFLCFLSIPLSRLVLWFAIFVTKQPVWMKPWLETDGLYRTLDKIQSETCSLQLLQPAAHSFTVTHGDERECEVWGELGRFMLDQSCFSFIRPSHLLRLLLSTTITKQQSQGRLKRMRRERPAKDVHPSVRTSFLFHSVFYQYINSSVQPRWLGSVQHWLPFSKHYNKINELQV